MPSYPVKWYSREMQGAPDLGDSAAGALAAMLKACLVTGFGTLPVTAISYDATTGWAVATVQAGHKYLQDSVLLVSRVTPAAYNGEHRVMKVSSTQVWLEMDGNPGAAGSGAAMSIKVAPLGWTISHESADGQILILRPTDVSASGNVSLRIDNSAWGPGWNNGDTGEVYFQWYLAKAQLVEEVVGINTFTLIYDHRWPCTKRYSDGRWDLIGDSQLFYYLPAYGDHNQQACFSFGYLKSVRPGDRYHAVLDTYASNSLTTSTDTYWAWGGGQYHTYYGGTFGKLNDSSQRVLARPYHQLFGTTSFSLRGLFSLMGTGVSVPNGADNGFYVSTDPVMVLESGNHIRGYMPGLIIPYGSVSGWNRKNFAGLPALPGKIARFIHVMRENNLYQTPATMTGFDITGPWR